MTAYGNHLIAQDWWDFGTWTWGGSGEINGTNAKQFFGYPSGNDYSSIGVTVDENKVRAGLIMATSFEDAIPIPPQEEEEMMLWFKSDDQIHWTGSDTLPEGDYPPNNGHIFTQTGTGQVMHVSSTMYNVYSRKPGAFDVVTIPGEILGALMAEYGVHRGASDSGQSAPVSAPVPLKGIRILSIPGDAAAF
jgi:hypothetical protein